MEEKSTKAEGHLEHFSTINIAWPLKQNFIQSIIFLPFQDLKRSTMESHFIPFPLNFTNLFLLLTFLFVLVNIWKKVKAPKLPPGPPKLPIIGNIHQFIGKPPHHALRDLAKQYGPLMHIKLGEVPSIIVSSAQMAKEILVTQDPAFAGRPESIASKIIWYDNQDLSFSPYGDYWKQMRKICMMELLSGKNVRSFSYIRRDEVSKLLESVRSSLGMPVNITAKLFNYTNTMTCRAAFGRQFKDKETMIEHTKQATALAGGFNVADLFPSMKILPIITGVKNKLLKMHRDLDATMDDVINQHIQNHKNGKKGNAETGDEDIVDVMLRLKESGNLQIPITSQNLKGVVFDMFTAGTDTSSSTSEWAMSELMRHPSVMAKAQAEVRQICKGKKTIEESDIQQMPYLKAVIKETLRLHPPIPMLPRTSRETREVNGYTIPKDIQVTVNAWAIGRDPEYWEDPESFKPERFEKNSIDFMGGHFQYLPFGTGRRICPGITFGLVNVEFPLAHLLYHFNWELPNNMKPRDLDMEEVVGITLGKKNNLNLIATLYDPSVDK